MKHGLFRRASEGLYSSDAADRPSTLLEAIKKAQRLLLETAASSAFANFLKASFEE